MHQLTLPLREQARSHIWIAIHQGDSNLLLICFWSGCWSSAPRQPCVRSIQVLPKVTRC